jgi:hypothetical protein
MKALNRARHESGTGHQASGAGSFVHRWWMNKPGALEALIHDER